MKEHTSRREFLKHTSAAAAGAAILGPMLVPRSVQAQGDDTLKVGLIGGGLRGSGAAADALSADPRNVLFAIGDAFEDQARRCRENLSRDETLGPRVKVDDERLFWGFDAYRRVVDSGVDVVLLTTPPHFRPEHLEYAVGQGKHCFVEKPIAVDAPGVRKVQALCEQARQRNLAIVSGLCYRYHPGVMETIQRIRDGAIGQIISIESHYNTGLLWHRDAKPGWSRMEYQIRNWLYYTWLSGDHITEQAVHSIDKTAWLQGDVQPISASGLGGRQQRTDAKFGNIYDHFAVSYEYPSGIRVYLTCRQQDNCTNFVDEIVLGTKGTAQILANEIRPHSGPAWKYEKEVRSMYQLEHEALFRSIRAGTPINNGQYMCNSTMLAIMGRMSSYTGQTLTWDACLADNERLGPAAYAWADVPEPEIAIPGKTTPRVEA